MSPVRVTFRRTFGQARGLYQTAFSVGLFLAAAGVLFAFRLAEADGSRIPLAAVWSSSVAPLLPVLATLLGMGVWSEERRTGRMDVLLASAVRERDFVLGKFLGVLCVMAEAVVLALLASLVPLAYVAPDAFAGVTVMSFAPGLLALGVQGVLWTAIAVMTSAFCRSAVLSAVVSLTLMVGLPRAVWAGLMAWSPAGRTAFGEFPLDAHVLDMSVGDVSLMTVVSYFLLTGVALFVSSKCVALSRCVGRGARGLRVSTVLACVLAVLCAALAVPLAMRVDRRIELSPGVSGVSFSPRTLSVLTEVEGAVSVSVFLSRQDARFRTVGHFFRALRTASQSVGGCRLNLSFVDPKWDFGAAGRLVELGAHEGSLVFEKGPRHFAVEIGDDFGERLCVSAIRRIALPPQRQKVYWTYGHGESAFDGYDAWGMSDIARDLTWEGYFNSRLDLAAEGGIPGDCALIVVAGARDDFSRAELARLGDYLRQGGRLLVLTGGSVQGGVASLLPAWGLRPVARPLTGLRTLSGTDVVVTDFSSHAVSGRLAGSQLVLERPITFDPSGVAENGTGADKIEFTSVATVGGHAVAAVVERGVGVGKDLSDLRPTRIVAVGDATFVANGPLQSRANANRDFFLNCVAFLAGAEASGGTGVETDRLSFCIDRAQRVRYVFITGLAVPAAVFLFFAALVFRRRRRT